MGLGNAMNTHRMGIGLFALGGAFLWISTAYAAEPPPKALYLKYCSACHGESGKGDGVVSGFLQPRPTDLTQIANKAGGNFPFLQVMQKIDGTQTVRAHGDSAMPVWGESFRRDIPQDALSHQVRIRGRLMLITEYLDSIQAK